GTEAEDHLEGVPKPPLGADCGCRFLYCGGLDKAGLQRIVVLFLIDLATRKVEIAGVASVAKGLWMSQIGRNVTDGMAGVRRGKRYLIHDRDPLFTREFLGLLEGIGLESAPLPPRSPNLNTYPERFVRSIKKSCLERMIWLGGRRCAKGSKSSFCIY